MRGKEASAPREMLRRQARRVQPPGTVRAPCVGVAEGEASGRMDTTAFTSGQQPRTSVALSGRPRVTGDKPVRHLPSSSGEERRQQRTSHSSFREGRHARRPKTLPPRHLWDPVWTSEPRGPPAGGHPACSGSLPVVSHRNNEEKQEGGSLNGGQKEEVIVQMTAINVTWKTKQRSP